MLRGKNVKLNFNIHDSSFTFVVAEENDYSEFIIICESDEYFVFGKTKTDDMIEFLFLEGKESLQRANIKELKIDAEKLIVKQRTEFAPQENDRLTKVTSALNKARNMR